MLSPVNNPIGDVFGIRGLALGVGYVITLIGWFLFLMGMTCLIFYPSNANNPDPDAQVHAMGFIVGLFRAAGVGLIPGWFLLRFGDNLFPFSRRLFRYAERSLL